MTPYVEITTVLKLKPKAGESFVEFAKRATDKINSINEKEWKNLSGDLQNWHNDTMICFDQFKLAASEAKKKGQAIPDASQLEYTIEDRVFTGLPPLEGYDGTEEEADEGDDAPAEEEEADAEDEPTEEAAEAEAEAESENEAAEAAGEDTEASEAPAARKKASGKKKATAVKKVAPKAAAKAKPTSAAKTAAKAPAKKKVAAERGRPSKFPQDAVLRSVGKCPYREGSLGAKIFAKYSNGITVAQFVKAASGIKSNRAPLDFLRYDVKQGYVKVA